MAKGGSNVLRGVIAFFLGFLFAIIVEVGVIVGAGYFLLYTDINSIFNFFGYENDDGRNNQIINTTNGVTTVLDLYNKIMGIAGNVDQLSISTIVDLSPALGAMLDDLYVQAENYGIYIDADEFEKQSVVNLGTYVREDIVMNIRPYELVVGLQLGEDNIFENNIVLQTLLRGAEAKFVDDPVTGESYLVYYDQYEYNTDLGGYYRMSGEAGVAAYPTNLDASRWLTETNAVNDAGYDVYRQYFYYDGENYIVTKKDLNDEFIWSEYADDVAYYSTYGSEPMHISGNYYYDENGEQVYFEGKEVTLGKLIDSNTTFESLEYLDADVAFTEMMGQESEVINALFEGISLGDFLEGNMDFDGRVGKLELPVILDVEPSNDIMAFIAYRINNIKYDAAHGYYTAVYQYTENGVTLKKNVIVNTVDGLIDTVIDPLTGEEIEPTKVEEISDVIQNIGVNTLIDINVSDKVIAYIGYGITDMVKTGSNTYSAKYHYADGSSTANCTVNTDSDGIIISVALEDGTPVNAATVEELSDRVTTITDVLALGDFVDIKVSSSSQNNNIMMFTAYSVTMNAADITAGAMTDGSSTYYEGTYHIFEDGAEPATAKARIYTDANGVISRVSYYDEALGSWLDGVKTSISGSTDQISRLTSALTIGDVVRITEEDGRLMNKLAGYVIDDIASAVDEIVLSDAIDITTDDDILLYLAFGVTDVTFNGTDYTATYNYADGTTTTDCVLVIEQGIVVGITASDGSKIQEIGEDGLPYDYAGTTLNTVADRVDSLTSTLKIKDLITIDPSDKILSLVADSTIDGLSQTVMNITVQDLYADEIYASGWYEVTVDNFDAQYLYYTMNAQGKYELVNGDGRLAVFDTAATYYSRGKAQGVWYLLTYSEGYEVSYTVNNLGEMMNNSTENMKTSTLQDFYEAGIIAEPSHNAVPLREATQDEINNPDITTETILGTTYVMKEVRYCTIDEMLEAINILSGIANQIGQP